MHDFGWIFLLKYKSQGHLICPCISPQKISTFQKMDQIDIFCPTLFRKNLDVYEFVV